MPYYMLQRIDADEPGFPGFLDYKLDKESAGTNSGENAFVQLLTDFSAKTLTFTCKHKRLEFDFYELKAGEFFVSEVFLNASASLSLPKHRLVAAQFVSA